MKTQMHHRTRAHLRVAVKHSKAHIALLILGAILAADPIVARADTFMVEIDYMGTDGTHDHQPSQLVLDAVIQMFACQGHTLIIDLDDELTHYDVLVADPMTNCGNFWSYNGEPNTYAKLREDNFDNGEGWHYCIFAHQYQSLNSDDNCVTSGSSGRANGVDALIVTLGNFDGETGTEYVQAATLAHELGHNLGLSHCGTMNCGSNDDDGSPDYVGPFVPIMPSVMSYTFQLRGVRTRMLDLGLTFDEALFKEIDFSHGRLCSLDENNLNEVRGTTMISTDWDCDGMLEANVVKDINESGNWCDTDGNLTTSIRDYDEWANIEDGAALARSGAPADQAKLEQRRQVMERMRPCISFEEWQQVQQEFQLRGGGPALTVESCISGENVYIGNSLVFEFGTCTFPFNSIQDAHDLSPSNSVFYIVPNTYDEAGSVLLDKPGKYFCKTGSALFQ